MKQKRKILPKLFAALVILTLISCCFLGTTFARYATGQSGKATAGVAKWDIGTDKEGSLDITVDKLSPSQDVFVAGTHATTPRENSTGIAKLVTITNNSEVAADITVNIGELGYEWQPGKATDFVDAGDAYAYSGSLKGSGVSEEQAAAVIQIKFYWDDAGAEEITDGAEKNLAANDGTAETVTIYYEVVWTSYDLGQTTADLPDAIDTWLGENLESVGCTISYTAVQASEQPTV